MLIHRFPPVLALVVIVLPALGGEGRGQDGAFSPEALKASEAARYAVKPVMDTPPDVQFQFEGYLKAYADAIAKNWLCVMERNNPEMLERFRNAAKKPYGDRLPWDGEYPGKHLTGAVEIYRLTRDKALFESIHDFVGKLVARQRPSGYLGVWGPEYELQGKGHRSICGELNWDMWNHYHIMVGLIYWYEESGDARALNSARRIADLLCEKYLKSPGAWGKAAEPYTNLSAGHSLALLYRLTGEKKYLELARQTLEVESAVSGLDFPARAKRGEEYFQKRTGSGATRWETLHLLLAYSELYLLTGNSDYRKVIEHYWWSLTCSDRHNNGGFSSLESAYGNPYDTRSIETCCTIAYTALGVEALRLTGNSRVADQLEMSALNAGFAIFARSGKWSTYNTVMEGRIVPCDPGRPGTHENPGIYCCTANAPRGVGVISHWALLADSDGLVVNWYGPGTMNARAKGVKVALTQSRNYPREDSVRFTVVPEKDADFTLKFRIPFWSPNTVLKVNGAPCEAKPGSYAALKRLWRKGDTVEIRFEMKPRWWQGEKEYAGRASIYRGPVLLAHRIASPRENAELKGAWTDAVKVRETQYYTLVGSEKAGDRAVFRFQGDWVSWRYNRFQGGGIARVFVDGKLLDTIDLYAENDMRDFFAYDRGVKGFFLSERWEGSGFGPGLHTLEIEVAGTKNAKSQGAWVYLREFHDQQTDPRFDAGRMAFELLPALDPQGLDVRVQAADADGRPVVLQDYDTASKDEKLFLTWMRVDGISPGSESSNKPSLCKGP